MNARLPISLRSILVRPADFLWLLRRYAIQAQMTDILANAVFIALAMCAWWALKCWRHKWFIAEIWFYLTR